MRVIKRLQLLTRLLMGLVVVVGLDGARHHRRPHCETLDRFPDVDELSSFHPIHKSTEQTDDISSYCIHRHNEHRRNHQVDDLEIDKHRLLPHARRVAAELSANKTFDFNKLPYGVNWGFTVAKWQCEEMVDKWYKTREYYNFTLRPEQANERNRWFTQLVWSRTTHLACALSTAVPILINQKAKFVFWNVCIYDPKGNIEGQFRHNVFPKFEED